MVFSVMKRKFGEALKARKSRLQVKEIKIKGILYNISRIISTFSFPILIEDFYRADNSEIHNTYHKSYEVTCKHLPNPYGEYYQFIRINIFPSYLTRSSIPMHNGLIGLRPGPLHGMIRTLIDTARK